MLKAIIIDELLDWIFGGIQMFLDDHRAWLKYSMHGESRIIYKILSPFNMNPVSFVVQQRFSR